MLPELLGKLIWKSGKMAIRYVVVPVAITAALAVGLREVTRRLPEPTSGAMAA
ncbi:MAG: hypothetical protein ACYDBQ_10915 [Thermoplasmatota archaeon]